MWHPFNCLWVSILWVLLCPGLQVVCRQLGFLSTGAVAYRNVNFGYGNGYMYSLLGIQCWQLEPYITDCVNDWYHLLVPACWPSSPGAGVSCQGEYPYNSLVPRSVWEWDHSPLLSLHSSLDSIATLTQQMIGHKLKTKQTTGDGVLVKRVSTAALSVSLYSPHSPPPHTATTHSHHTLKTTHTHHSWWLQSHWT